MYVGKEEKSMWNVSCGAPLKLLVIILYFIHFSAKSHLRWAEKRAALSGTISKWARTYHFNLENKEFLRSQIYISEDS
jgi:hypothetical protein